LLDARRAPAITGGRRRTALEIELLTALVAVRSGQREDARASFENAVKAASEERHLGPFLEERDAVAALMMDVGHEFSASEFLAPLRAQDCLAAPGSMNLENGETLTERECDVLSLVADGLSNAEICERLHLALDTVKGHNRRIFEKLEVKRRTQAVAKARDLGFIQR
jgi:LuxR family maltose regulon positive regulatory protein